MLPGTWHWEHLEHFLCIITAITTTSRSNSGSSGSSTRPSIAEDLLVLSGCTSMWQKSRQLTMTV